MNGRRFGLDGAVDWTLAVTFAIAAGLHRMLLAAVLVNDDFMHRVYAAQLMAGEWPVRDFFDYGMVLMYSLSALAQWVLGERLLSEAIVIGVMTAASTFLVFSLVRRISGSRLAATLSALILLIALPRGYGYPKLIVYAVAAYLWWTYSWKPERRTAVGLGVWAAIAFYWRPDHGLYVALGFALAIIAAHGADRAAVRACIRSGVVAIALVAPWIAFASGQMGTMADFARSGLVAAVEEHRTRQSTPRWPIRRLRDVLDVEPPDAYAPVIRIRWTSDSSLESRHDLIRRYALTPLSTADALSLEVRLTRYSPERLRALLAEPIVEDTHGIDRGSATIPLSEWPLSERRRFENWWRRIRVFPGVHTPVEAGEAAAILLFALPLVAVGIAVLLARHLPAGAPTRPIFFFAVFALLVDFGLLRTPFYVRAADAVVLPAILLGLSGSTLLRATAARSGWRRWLPRAAGAVVLVLLTKSLAVAGQSVERIQWLAGEWVSVDRARGAWEEVSGRLTSSPPIEYWRNRRPELTLRFASYAHECLPQEDRILALWFAPEIYYYSKRLMSGRHIYFMPPFGRLAHESQMELKKIRRSPPQIVFTKTPVDRAVEDTFPWLLELLDREYHAGGWETDRGERYLILVRKDRTPVRAYGQAGWPCYR